MSRFKWILAILGLMLCAIALFFMPMTYEQVVREGTDRFEAHYPLWGTRFRSVSVDASSPVTGIGFILVNLRRVPSLPPVHISVTRLDGIEIFQSDTALQRGADDAFTWTAFPRAIAKSDGTVVVTVSAPHAERSSAIGIRFDTDNGELALGLTERIPLWKYIVRWANAKPELAEKVEITLFGGVGLAFVLWVVRDVWIFSLIILFLCTIAIRIPLASAIDSAYGGDAFNYLLKSRAWIDGSDPFAADPRKAPVYPFIVMPGLAMPFDAIIWERWVNMFAAGGSVVLVSLVLVRLGLPYSFALAGGTLLAVNRDFQFESVQGLSNTLYAFFVLLTGYVFVLGKTYFVAIVSGLAFLTRYEGGIIAAILLPASIAIHKLRGRMIIHAVLPALILMLIPFIFFPLTHSIGVRTVSDIAGDDGLHVAYSLDDFASNFKAFHTWFGRLWVLTPNIGSLFEWLGIGVVMGMIFACATPSRMRRGGAGSLLRFLPSILIILFLTLLVRNISEEAPFIVGGVSLLAGIGIAVSVIRYPKQYIPLIVMLAMHTIVVTAILPKDRYYLPLIPYFVMMIIVGAYALVYNKSRLSRIGMLLFVSFLIAFTYADAKQALPGQVSDYNEKSAGQTVLLNAARYVKHVSGIVAVADGSDLQIRSYISADRVAIFPDSLRDTSAQLALITEKNVSYIINTTENPYFTKLIHEMPEKFEEVAAFTTKWSDIRAILYRVNFN